MRFLFCFVVVCVALVFAGSYFALRKYVKKVDEKVICSNIYIGNVDVSGLTAGEAKKLLKNHLEKDKALTVVLKAGDGEEKAVLEEFGLSAQNVDTQIKKAVEYGKKGSIWGRYRKMKNLEKEKLVLKETFSLDEKSVKAVLKERVSSYVKGAVDATIEKDAEGFTITPEKDGKKIHAANTIKKVTEYLNHDWDHKGFSVKVSTQKDKPKITEKDLSEIQDELGSFSTDAGGGDRWTNLKRGVDILNGQVLMPGEEISIYNTTSPYDEEHGYVQAGAYENGQVVPAYGGGICQVSTTLYNAVIYAELEIVKRGPHSMLVAYVDPSRDAAIAGDYLDLIFKNTYDSPVMIFGEIDSSNQLRFAIYGKETRPENRTVEFESETLSTEDYGVEYKENSESSLGNMEYTGSPHVGKEAKLWKVVYEDGKEVSRDVFNTSTYSKSDEIIEVGTACDNEEAARLVRSAIETQDEGKINAAIEKAKSMISGSGASADDADQKESGSGDGSTEDGQ